MRGNTIHHTWCRKGTGISSIIFHDQIEFHNRLIGHGRDDASKCIIIRGYISAEAVIFHHHNIERRVTISSIIEGDCVHGVVIIVNFCHNGHGFI